jgi:RNA polymerase sigma-70 factor, ECF subfamily
MAMQTNLQQEDHPQIVHDIVAHWDTVCAYCTRVMSGRPNAFVQAQDITQETMIKAIKFHANFRSESKLSSWLIKIARRTMVDRYRRYGRRDDVLVSLDAMSPSEEPFDLPAELELAAARKEAARRLLGLNPELRETMRLHFQDLPQKQIGKLTKTKEKTVKTRIHRGLIKLRQQ